ncbi:hypothetical protein [Amycolatopsis sp. NPDC051061]|uniref:hypothetical protein n=1 Tax=Amycolatopsis sp. NPDC051061 TaxID=3155042 RepID=UPI003446C3FD
MTAKTRGYGEAPTTLRWLLVLVVLLATTAGCGDDHPMEPSLSLAEAQQAAANQIREAAAGTFPPGFTLEELPPQPLNCTDSSGKPTGQVLLGVTFWVNDLPGTDNNAYFGALKAWWAGHGWTLSTDSRPEDMFINATRDGYLMSLRANVNQRLAIGNSTPCVWRNRTPGTSS